MIDKAFLEQQLNRLQQQHNELFRNTEQVVGAIVYTQSLLRKLEDDAAAEANKPPED